MPQDGRYRRRSRSRSRSKRNRRRRHGSSKSSGSSYSRSRSRSRSPEKRYRDKERSSRRTPPKYRRSSKRSPSHERKRQRYDRRSRSESSSPRRQSNEKKEYHLDSSKVLTGNFSNIPGLDYIGRGGKGVKNESSQDLDLRLRELETQQGSAGSSRSRAAEQSKNAQRGYYDSKGSSQESYKQRSRSPVEKKYESSRYSKERAMSPDSDRYRDQKDRKQPDYGIRVEVKRKPSPKRRKFDPRLVFIPRRKDEGLQPLFDRPEIIVRNLDDDPEMYPEKYERFACWRKSPEHSERKNDREYSREREERPRKQSRHHKESRRSPSPDPQQPRAATVMMKPFTVYEKFEQSLRNKPAPAPQEMDSYLPRSQDFSLSQSSLPLSGSTSMFSSGLGLDNVLDVGSDLRLDLDVRRQFLVREAEKQLDLQQLHSNTSPTLGRLPGSAFSLDRREIASSDRRPVRERLGDLDRGGLKMDSDVPDFRKEVEELQRLDPTAQPIRGKYFQHDDRDQRSLSEEKRDIRPSIRGRGGFVPRGSYRGGRGFIRGFRGRFNRGFRGSYNRGYSGWSSSRGGYASSWKHDKFEGKGRDGDGKREKKEKKSKSSDKKKTKKSSKKTPERSKSKRESKK